MQKKILGGILAILIIGGGAYFVDRYYLRENTSPIIGKPAVDDLKTQTVEKPSAAKVTSDKLVYLVNSDSAKEVVINDPQGSAAKVLFTDKDEDQKVQEASDIAYLSREVLLYVGSDTSGQFFIVKLDSSGGKEVIDKVSKPLALAISPDGQEIAYAFFSNVETSLGNNIVIMNRKGENRRILFTTQNQISSIAFNEEASEIIFSKTSADNKSTISQLSVGAPKEKEIYQGSSTIPTLSWSKTGEIIFTLVDSKFTTSQIFTINSSGGGSQKILETKNGVASYPHLATDDLSISYLAAVYKDKFDSSITGDVKVATATGQNINKIAQGIQILGWLP